MREWRHCRLITRNLMLSSRLLWEVRVLVLEIVYVYLFPPLCSPFSSL
jgi:hypothetical protein